MNFFHDVRVNETIRRCGFVEGLLCRLLPYKDIGWDEIGEEFTRWTLLKTPWGNVYLHRLKALTEHPQCHDHPWSFVAVLLRGGYNEKHAGVWTWRRPGSILIRPAEYSHNVTTRGVSWSLIITTNKRRDWSFNDDCH
jgi:hypothetical protein